MLSGREGELVSVSIDIDPRRLETLLEALALVGFPINPEIYHGPVTSVEFPAYHSRLDDVRSALRAAGLRDVEVRCIGMLEKVAAAH
jgi:hypothetical protein